jgi:hypothetical protein
LNDRNVLPFAQPLTELDARELLGKSLLSLCSDRGPTRVGLSIGCDEKTVRNARDEKSTLRLDFALNLLGIASTAFDPALNHFGLRAVPKGSRCDTDSDRASQSQVLKAALALSVALEDDDQVDVTEVKANKATIIAARDALDGLLAKLDAPALRKVK